MTDPQEIARGIPFDRGPSHHDERHTGYCVECRICTDCAEKEVAAALVEYGDARYTTGCIETYEEAEAEGFERGFAERKELIEREFHRGVSEGHRRGAEETRSKLYPYAKYYEPVSEIDEKQYDEDMKEFECGQENKK